MKKFGAICFLALVFAICLTPLVWMLIDGPAPSAANETLAAKPQLRRNGALNLDYLADACDYFADHFGGRQELITANAVLESALLRESASEKVILGTDGWLYYASTLEDYQGTAPMSERELFAAARHLSLLREYAETQGASFLFTVAPNKNTLYPAHMPTRYTPSAQSGNLDRLQARLEVPYLDLKALFSQEPAVLYHATDSHWTNLGAALAGDAILDALGKNAVQRYQPELYTAELTFTGDLYRMLYPAGTKTAVQYRPAWDWTFSYTKPLGTAEDQSIETSNAGKGGSLLLFRDSFGNTLYPFLAEEFGEARISRAMPYDLTLMDGADTLVIEIVERNLRWMAQIASIFPAPVRELALPADETAVDAAVGCEATRTGLYCVSGTLSQAPDADSPIWLAVNGVVYESTPVGSADGSFTAYLPEEPTQVQLVFRRGGAPVLSQCINPNKEQ